MQKRGQLAQSFTPNKSFPLQWGDILSKASLDGKALFKASSRICCTILTLKPFVVCVGWRALKDRRRSETKRHFGNRGCSQTVDQPIAHRPNELFPTSPREVVSPSFAGGGICQGSVRSCAVKPPVEGGMIPHFSVHFGWVWVGLGVVEFVEGVPADFP